MPRLLLLLALAAVASAPAAAAQTCSTSWASPVDGDWDDGTKWTDGLPDAADDACITVAGTYTVTIRPDDPATVDLVTLRVASPSSTHVSARRGSLSCHQLDAGDAPVQTTSWRKGRGSADDPIRPLGGVDN